MCVCNTDGIQLGRCQGGDFREADSGVAEKRYYLAGAIQVAEAEASAASAIAAVASTELAASCMRGVT
jgi:hypothetical protein